MQKQLGSKSTFGLLNGHNAMTNRLMVCTTFLLLVTNGGSIAAQQVGLQDEAKLWKELSSDEATAYRHEKIVWLGVNTLGMKNRKVIIPRVCAPIKSISWNYGSDKDIKFWPEPDEWIFSWKVPPNEKPVVKVVFDTDPVLPIDCKPLN